MIGAEELAVISRYQTLSSDKSKNVINSFTLIRVRVGTKNSRPVGFIQ